MGKKKKFTTKGKGKIVSINGNIRGKIADIVDPRFAVDFEEPALPELGLKKGDQVDFFMIPTDANPDLYLAIAVTAVNPALIDGTISDIDSSNDGGEITPTLLKKKPLKFKLKHIKKLSLKKGSKVQYLLNSSGTRAICVRPK